MSEELLGYKGLQERLAIDGKKPCMRKVHTIAKRHRHVLRPVKIGQRVAFRPERVSALLAHLAGDPQIGGLQL